MENVFTKSVFKNFKSHFILMLFIQIFFTGNISAMSDKSPIENGKSKKILPPPTPTVVLSLPPSSGSTCNSVLTASGCVASSVAWFTGSVFYSSANPLTVTSLTPVILKAACFDGVAYGSFSPEYKAVTATYTEVTPLTSITICEGNTATLNASSAFAGLSYQWIKNGTNISGATAASYGATTTGNYNVFATNGSCSSTSLGRSVTVNAITTPIISASATGSCGSQTITMSTQSLPAGTFQWKLNGNDISGATSSSYSTAVVGSYTVVYTSNSCVVTSAAYYFNQNAAPTVTLIPPISPNCYSELSATGCAGTVNWYKWTAFNFQGSGNTFFIGQSYPPEEYYATCTVNGCTSPLSSVIKASGFGYTEILPKVSVICGGASLLNASSVNSGLTYQWKRNNVNISGANSSTYSATLGGQYTLDASYGSCIFNAANATVYSDLTIIGSGSGACGSQSVNMSLPAILPAGTYQWKLNGNPISGATSATYSTSILGTYTVDYTFNSCTVTSLPYIFTQTAPTIALVPPVSPSCNSTMTATGCSGTVRWYRNTGSSYVFVTTLNPYTFPTTGITEYRATCLIGSCESSPSNTISAIPNNFTEITPTNPVLCGGSALLNASSTFSGLTYQWGIVSSGNISGATNPSYTATATGSYYLSVTNGTCSYTSPIVTVTNPIMPVVSPSFTGTCGSQTVNMSTQSGLLGTFQWKLNGVDISGATSSSYSTAVAGSYTVAYTYAGCTLTSLAYVFAQNNAPTITLNSAVSPSCSSSLSASGCSGTIFWYRNTGSSWVFQTSGNNPYFFPASNRPPEYRATCSANSCESTPSNALKATPYIFTEITPSPTVTICSNASTLLNASSTFSGLTYQWRLNSSNISGATSSSYAATLAGNYQLFVTNGSCTFLTAITTVSVTTAPTLSITSTVASPATITNGQSLTLTANGCSGGTVLWSNSATTTSITVSPSSNTTYTFTCTQPPCTVVSSGFVINVNALLPPILSSSAVSTCTGSSVTLTATACAGGGTVTWSTSQTGLSISVSPSITTSYTATCTVGLVTSANSTPISIAVFDGTITSLASGDWNTPTTWSCNCIPAACNDVIVDTGHIVTIPVTQKGRLQNLTLRGTVDVKTTGTMALK